LQAREGYKVFTRAMIGGFRLRFWLLWWLPIEIV
jgi:hypothetical protein